MFRWSMAALVGLFGLFGTAAAQNPPAASAPSPPPGDLGLLQGYWKPLSILFEGRSQMPPEEMAKVTSVFDQAEYHLYYRDKAKDVILKLAIMNVTLDATTTPKTIHFEFANGPLKGQKRHGIYEIAGNELKLCYGPTEKAKPTRFEAPDKSGYFLEVWAKQPKK